MQQAGEAVLLGALAVQGSLVAGELAAQPGDGVVRGGQLRGGRGEGSVVPLQVLLAGASSIRAGLPGGGHGGLPLGAGRGDGLLRFGDPGRGGPAFAVQGMASVAGLLPGCWRAAASACIAVMAWAAARASAASSPAACRATAWLAVSARARSIWAAASARTASAWASAALRSPAAASWAPRTASWSSTAGSCAPNRVIAASASSRMTAARLTAAVTGRSPPGCPASWARRRNAVIAVCRTSTTVPSPQSSATSCSQ